MQRRRAAGAVSALVLLLGTLIAVVAPRSAAAEDAPTQLYLVTLAGPGTGTDADTWDVDRILLVLRQDAVLREVGSPQPTYRWTAALNGFAVELTRAQADRLASLPDVASVEPNSIRRLAGAPDAAATSLRAASDDAGAGVVIGVVDTGLAPQGPLFTAFESGAAPDSFRGGCADGDGWSDADCNGKVVGARWYVAGFGADAVAASAALSPLDTDGHGTEVSSIAAGNADVPVEVAGESLGAFSGVAPAAHLAVYKACWTAPNPDDDGCATADLVTAIDDATADGVDVLTLSVAGPAVFDTVEMALLGATEAGAVVVGAAGSGRGTPSAHPGPWVTTVGATTGDARLGRVVLADGTRLTGAMLSGRATGLRRVLLASRAAAPGSSAAEARVCTPGSLDAARTAGRIVLCERGRVGRVDKSSAVALADGAGMVLLNRGRGSVSADIHSVPTVHLGRADATRLLAWAARHPAGRLRLQPLGVVDRRPRVAAWSASGAATVGVVKPDVVAAGTGVLGSSGGAQWDFVTGTSAATAYTAGVAASLLAREGWSPIKVRSALATTARPLRRASVLDAGSGLVDPAAARRTRLALLVSPLAYRAWLRGERAELNLPSVVLRGGSAARRILTNTGTRTQDLAVSLVGFDSHVHVRPTSMRLGPGETGAFRVRGPRGSRLDEGYVVWTGQRGQQVRIPVILTR